MILSFLVFCLLVFFGAPWWAALLIVLVLWS
jgi:hypothetical protein